MNDIHINFVGWNHKEEHDKIWVSFKSNNTWYCAWGRRGGKLQFKKHKSQHDVDKLQQQKLTKGYNRADSFTLFTVFPDFNEKVEKELCYSILAGIIK